MSDEPRRGAAFWVGTVVGGAVVLFGIRGLLENEPRGAPSAIRWFIGGALVLDLLVVPLIALVGFGLKKVVATWAWPIVATALGVSALLTVFASPLILEPDGPSSIPSIRPRNYEVGLAVALAWTWLLAGLALLVRRPRPATARGRVD